MGEVFLPNFFFWGEKMEREYQVPQSDHAEKSVLGSILVGYQEADEAFLILKPEHFYQRRHQILFEVMLDLFEQNKAVDLVLVQEELLRRKVLEKVGGIEYLAELTEYVPTARHCVYYAQIVRDKYLLRSLLEVCGEISKEVQQSTDPVSSIIDRAEAKLFELTRRHSPRSTYPIKEVLKDAFLRYQNLRSRKLTHTGIPTGYIDLDAMTGGFEPGQFIVLAARPSMGKTTLALNMIQRMAMREGKSILLFSMEMSKDQVVNNMICSFARVNSHRLRRGILSDSEWSRVGDAINEYAKCRIFVDDSAGLSIMELRTIARKMKLQENIDILFIDYLQLIQGGKGESRQQEISYISRSLKTLAKELEIPVVALSQLSRAVEAREDHRPRLSDLRESGAIEQDADLVLMLYREAYYKREKEKLDPEKQRLTEVIVAKQRNGPTGVVKILFFNEYMRFEDYAPDTTLVGGP